MNIEKHWDLADAAIAEAYPGWLHIPNNGILRGAIVKAIRRALASPPETPPSQGGNR